MEIISHITTKSLKCTHFTLNTICSKQCDIWFVAIGIVDIMPYIVLILKFSFLYLGDMFFQSQSFPKLRKSSKFLGLCLEDKVTFKWRHLEWAEYWCRTGRSGYPKVIVIIIEMVMQVGKGWAFLKWGLLIFVTIKSICTTKSTLNLLDLSNRSIIFHIHLSNLFSS